MAKTLEHPTRFQGERSRWLVPSDSEETPHFVDMDEYDGVGWCSCASHQFRCQPLLDRGNREQTTVCKHILRVREEIDRQLKEAGFKKA